MHTYITPEGRKWFADAGEILHKQLKLKKPIDYKINLKVYLCTAKGQDVDNLGKCLFDLLQKCQFCMKNKCGHKFRILENDRLIYDFHIMKQDVPHLNEQSVEIEISPFLLEKGDQFIKESFF